MFWLGVLVGVVVGVVGGVALVAYLLRNVGPHF